MTNTIKLTALLLGGLASSTGAFATEFFVRPTVAYVKSSYESYDNKVAPSFAAGVYLGKQNQHEIAASVTYVKWDFDDLRSGVRYQSGEKFLPLLVDYKYHVAGLDELRDVSFYFGPTLGVTRTKLWLKASGTSLNIESNDTDWAFTYGGTAGFVIKIAPHLDLDLGYHYVKLNQSKYQVFGTALYSDHSHTQMFSAGVGYHF